jgi:hypothetical protein
VQPVKMLLRRQIKTQTVLPSADTAAMLFWALLASGQISMRKVDGWQTLATKPIDQPIDRAAWNSRLNSRGSGSVMRCSIAWFNPLPQRSGIRICFLPAVAGKRALTNRRRTLLAC